MSACIIETRGRTTRAGSNRSILPVSVRAKFAWYDLWVGAFIERNDPDHRWIVYVCPLPTLLFIFRGPFRG